jgi:hypothetical protein
MVDGLFKAWLYCLFQFEFQCSGVAMQGSYAPQITLHATLYSIIILFLVRKKDLQPACVSHARDFLKVLKKLSRLDISRGT